MVRGFKDSNNKFHPITQSKGVRKSRDQSTKTEGIRMKRYRKKLVDMSPAEIQSLEIVGDIEENFDGILARTAMNKNCKIERGKLIRLGDSDEDLLPEGTQVEEICGAVTDHVWIYPYFR